MCVAATANAVHLSSNPCKKMAISCKHLGVTALRAVSHSRAPSVCGAGGATLEHAARRFRAGCRWHRRMAIHSLAADGNGTAMGVGAGSAAMHAADSSSSSSRPFVNSSGSRPRVCILGGGFGGLYTAIKLELLMWPRGKKPQVTLVDQGERFIFKPLLYELINGTAQAWEVAPTFAQLLAPYPIQFVQDKVLEVQPEQLLKTGGSSTGGSVRLASGGTIEYDWLVLSLGAAADPRGVPGVREHAHPFVSLEDAEYVAQQLAAYEARAALGQPPATVAVVGAGYAGVEIAAVVGERLKGKARVVLLTPGMQILEAAPPGQREAAEQALQSLGVDIMTGWKVTAVRSVAEAAAVVAAQPAAADEAADPLTDRQASMYQQTTATSNGSSSDYSTPQQPFIPVSPAAAPYTVQLEPSGPYGSSTAVPADLVLWTAGSKPASQSLQPFPADAGGQLQTDATLRVLHHSRVFALGDVSKGQPGNDGSSASAGGGQGAMYPATAQVAFQQADYAAWNIWSAINGRPLLPFRYQHLGDMMSLGATNAAVALPLQLPSELSASITASPLGPLLSLVGLKLGSGQQQQSAAVSSGEGVTLEGPLAQLLRRAAYLYRQPTNEQRLNVAASWVQQAADAAARLAAEVSANSSSSSSSGIRR